MQVKKEAYENIKRIVDDKINELNYKKIRNKININDLVNKQKILKKEIQKWFEIKKTLG